MLPDYNTYATFIYTLEARFSSIQKAQVNCFMTQSNIGMAKGVIYFSKNIRLGFVEHLNFSFGKITYYSYEVWQRDQKLYYYDSQEHPNDPTLASTHPHHKHIPPDIKHHRIPAPGLSFDKPNLQFLIHEIEDTLLKPA